MSPDFTSKDVPPYELMSRGPGAASVITPAGEHLARVLNVSTNHADPAFGGVATMTITVTGFTFKEGPPPEHVLKAFGLTTSDFLRDGAPIRVETV